MTRREEFELQRQLKNKIAKRIATLDGKTMRFEVAVQLGADTRLLTEDDATIEGMKTILSFFFFTRTSGSAPAVIITRKEALDAHA